MSPILIACAAGIGKINAAGFAEIDTVGIAGIGVVDTAEVNTAGIGGTDTSGVWKQRSRCWENRRCCCVDGIDNMS